MLILGSNDCEVVELLLLYYLIIAWLSIITIGSFDGQTNKYKTMLLLYQIIINYKKKYWNVN